MLFVQKGYCRCDGKKCRYLKVKNGIGWCKKKKYYSIPGYGYDKYAYIRNAKTGYPKKISSDKKINIRAPKWCPKF